MNAQDGGREGVIEEVTEEGSEWSWRMLETSRERG